jgi:hypothetical protein
LALEVTATKFAAWYDSVEIWQKPDLKRLWEEAAKYSKPSSNVINNQRRGRKSLYNWTAAKNKVFEILDYYGTPGIDQPELKSSADIERKLADWFVDSAGTAPSESSIRKYISEFRREWEARKANI